MQITIDIKDFGRLYEAFKYSNNLPDAETEEEQAAQIKAILANHLIKTVEQAEHSAAIAEAINNYQQQPISIA